MDAPFSLSCAVAQRNVACVLGQPGGARSAARGPQSGTQRPLRKVSPVSYRYVVRLGKGCRGGEEVAEGDATKATRSGGAGQGHGACHLPLRGALSPCAVGAQLDPKEMFKTEEFSQFDEEVCNCTQLHANHFQVIVSRAFPHIRLMERKSLRSAKRSFSRLLAFLPV